MNKTIGTNVKVLRKSKDISQKDLAKVLDITQNSLSQKESGLITFQIEELVRIANYFGVKIDDLVNKTLKIETQIKVVAL